MAGRTRVVLFIVTSFWAYGELAIATEFARRMGGTDFRPLFLIPPSHRRTIAGTGLPYRVLVPGAGRVNRIQLHDIYLTHRPAFVILADFMNFDFCERHYGLLRADLDVFQCPVGTFDNFTWGRRGAWLDTYGFKARYEGDISLDGLSFRLRPCPLNNPAASSPAGSYAYALLGNSAGCWLDDMDDNVGLQVRRELDIPSGRPVVLLTCATWQHMHACYPRVNAYVDACTAMLERLIRQLLEHAAVLLVGPSMLFRSGAPPGFRALGQLDPVRFRAVAKAVDVHVSNNIVSVSLHRLALAGILSVALYSSLAKSGGTLRSVAADEARAPRLSRFAVDVIAGVDYLYPFRMFPVGWYYFLDSILAANPFTAVVSQAEIFQEVAAAEKVISLFTPGKPRSDVESARWAYLHALHALPDVPDILSDLSALARA